MARGCITKEITEASKKFMGCEITVRELRLLPYLQDCLMNCRTLSRQSLNEEETGILFDWKERGYISGDILMPVLTKEFYDFMCEVLYYSYIKK